MKVALIIPLYKQSKYWSKVLSGIRKQSRLPDAIYLVLDRPTMDSPSAITDIEAINNDSPVPITILTVNEIPSHITRTSENIFLAGYCRNLGINNAIADGCDVFIFIDGDCIPQQDHIQSHINLLQNNLPMISVGRRREAQYRWLDQREITSNLTHLKLFDKKGLLINNPNLIKQCLILWSCNFGINLHALQIIKKFNMTYFNRSELFNSDFDGAWGGEDSFLGVVAWYCRIYIHTVGAMKSGVEHIDHPRPTNIYNKSHKDFFESQCERLRKKVDLNPLDLSLWISSILGSF